MLTITLQDGAMLLLDAYVWPFLTDSEREAYDNDEDPLTAQVCVDREEFEYWLQDNGYSNVEAYLWFHDRDDVSYIICDLLMCGGVAFAYCDDLRRIFMPPDADPDSAMAAVQEFIGQRVHTKPTDTVIDEPSCEETDTTLDDAPSQDDIRIEPTLAETDEPAISREETDEAALREIDSMHEYASDSPQGHLSDSESPTLTESFETSDGTSDGTSDTSTCMALAVFVPKQDEPQDDPAELSPVQEATQTD